MPQEIPHVASPEDILVSPRSPNTYPKKTVPEINPKSLKPREQSLDSQSSSFKPRLPGGYSRLSPIFGPRLPGGHSRFLVSSETQEKGSHVASPEDILVSPRARPQLPIEGTPDPSEDLEFQPTSIKPRLPGGHSCLSLIFGPRLPGGHSRFLVSSETKEKGSHVASLEDILVSPWARPQLPIEGTLDFASQEDIPVLGFRCW